MERVQPLSGVKSLATLLYGDAGGTVERMSGPSVLELKLSNDDHHGPAPTINLLSSLEDIPQKKPENPSRNFKNALAIRPYSCKYCKAKFASLQSLGGHQSAHRREIPAKRRAQVMTGIADAVPWVNPNFSRNYSGTQVTPVSAYGPRAWPAPTDAVKPTYWWMPKPTAIMNPQASAWYRPAVVNQLNGMVYPQASAWYQPAVVNQLNEMVYPQVSAWHRPTVVNQVYPQASAWHRPAVVNELNGMVYQPMNYNGDPHFRTWVPPQSTGPRPPFANVFAGGSSSGAQGLEDGGLDLTLRL